VYGLTAIDYRSLKLFNFISEWGADEWSALGNIILSISVTIAGFWTLYNFSRTRKTDRAQWLKQIFVEFYLDDSFSVVRSYLEYNYEDKLSKLIERRFFDRDITITDHEASILKELDQLLNYFEHLLYLEDSGLLLRKDRDAIFEYWFDILSAPEKAVMRRYTGHFGFERVAKALNASTKNYIFLYGSLRQDQSAYKELELDKYLNFVQKSTLMGSLYDLGEYPGLVQNPKHTKIAGELFEVQDHEAIKILDKFERYYADNHAESLYLRRCIQLEEPNIEAWTYFYNTEKDERDYKSAQLVESGDWIKHLASRNTD